MFAITIHYLSVQKLHASGHDCKLAMRERPKDSSFQTNFF